MIEHAMILAALFHSIFSMIVRWALFRDARNRYLIGTNIGLGGVIAMVFVFVMAPGTATEAMVYGSTMLYNSWYMTATDDDLCEFGSVGRWLMDRVVSRYENVG